MSHSSLRFVLKTFIFVGLVTSQTKQCVAQDGSLLRRGPRTQQAALVQPAPTATLANSSYLFQPVPPELEKRGLRKGDIITVLMDYNSYMNSQSDVSTKRSSNLAATLSDWLRWDGKSLRVAPQTAGDPKIGANYSESSKAEGDASARDSLTFRIAVMIEEILPNGNLRIYGSRNIQVNEEEWQQFVTGVVQRQSIGQDRTVRSEEIFQLRVKNTSRGVVRNGVKQGWFTRFYDKVKPI